MKILITGSSGFIGYHLADELLKRKYDIIGIDNNNNYYPSIIKKRLKKLKKNKKFRFYKLNLINKKKLEKFLQNINRILFSIWLDNLAFYLPLNIQKHIRQIMYMLQNLFVKFQKT